MTRNQIAYHQMREQQRANQAQEAETHRSNTAREQETYRSNTTRESISRGELGVKQQQAAIAGQQLLLDERKLAETKRHNVVTEALSPLSSAGGILRGIGSLK